MPAGKATEENIWNKVKKSSKIGQSQKFLISAFVLFLTAIANFLFEEWRLGANDNENGECLPPNLDFSII